MRTAFHGLLIFVAVCVCHGCGLAQMGQDTARMFTPNGRDSNDGDDIYDGRMTDEWSVAGKEGRGDRPIEREADGLTKYLSSDKARRIGRNLGTDAP